MSKTIKIGGRIESAEQGGIVTGANAILDDTKGKKQNVINSETDAELARLDNAKQDVLTFDNAPTEGSNNPVKSGGVYAADAALQQAIEAILQLIPSAATAMNQLADKAFVNSTEATNTATFRGTYNVVTDLSLHYNSTHQEIATALLSVVQTADNNDYCFVQIPVSDSSGDIRVTERYKFNGTAWSYEYDLNNSGFTADQWAAINSTITLALVQKLGALPTAAELAQQLALKQNTLTFDTAPVAGSSNPVTSGGLYNVIAAINATIPSGASVDNKLVAESRLTQYVAAIVNALDATFNVTSTDGHVNVQLTQVDGVITSFEVITNDIASAEALNNLAGRVTTNEGNISLLQAAYNALQQSAPVIIQTTDTWPVASPSATVIYRVIDRVNTPPQYYSDYMFSANDLTTPVIMATYNNAIDPRPKKGSQNLVTSGGVFDNMGALDVSELNATENPHTLATYADLSTALAAIPSDYQKGGMSIKFVQSSDNKYVQYRLMSDTFSATESDWQGVDDKPTVGSDNLVKSEGVFNETDLTKKIIGLNAINTSYNTAYTGKYIRYSDGVIDSHPYYKISDIIHLEKGESIFVEELIVDTPNVVAALSKYENGTYKPILLGYTTPRNYFYYAKAAGDYVISWCYTLSTPVIKINTVNSDYYALKDDIPILPEIDINDVFDVVKNYYDKNKSNSGYVDNGGGVFEHQSFRYTDYIKVNAGDIVKFKHATVLDTQIGCGYDENKTYKIDLYTIRTLTDGINTLTIPLGIEYIRVNLLATEINSFAIVINKNYTNIIEGYQYSISVPNYTNSKIKGEDVRVDNIIFNNLGFYVKKCICVGDSVTEGIFGDYPHGYSVSGTSYPERLAQIFGWNVVNAGVGGYTVTDWWNNKFNDYNFANYELCLIEFCFNQIYTDTIDTDAPLATPWVAGNNYSVGDAVSYDGYRYVCTEANNDSTFDISKWTPDTSNYANTYTGNYCKLIEAIKAENRNIFIVIIISQYSPGEADSKYTIPKKIAERYNIPVIDFRNDTSVFNLSDMKYHGYSQGNPSIFDTIHFKPIGYMVKAAAIQYYLGKIFNDRTIEVNNAIY